MSITSIVKEHGPIKRAALAKLAGLGLRELREEIAFLNHAGVPLVFTHEGYVYSRKRSEVNECAGSMISAGISLIKRGAALKKIDVEQAAQGLFA